MTTRLSGFRSSVFAACVAFVLGAGVLGGGFSIAYAANDETTQVLVGSSTTIALDGNPSTGYSWVLDGEGSENAELVSVENLGSQAASVEPGKRPVLGAPKVQTFKVTGVAEGEAKLKFDYVRSGDAAPAKSVDVVVEVIGVSE